MSMYVLERRKDAGGRPHWEPYALCGTRPPLERVLQGQPDRKAWRVIRRPGTVVNALKDSSGPTPALKAG